uniref:Uncharacterized protein n=1 Tax=Trichobilharzia regenti TaxID=157069 RepID=A0AA85IXV1_TRIRE|nr:unnamed protein product [Trichobilharzia regenti]
MCYFLLLITSFILLHIQQSTQNDLQTLLMRRTLIQSKLRWNAVDLQKNNATLLNITKALQERIENINIQLSPDGLSINDYAACTGKLLEAETGFGLMQRYIANDIVKMKECFQNKKKNYEGIIKGNGWEACSLTHPELLHEEIEEMTNMIAELYSEIKEQAETVFRRKLYTSRSNELEKSIATE